MIDQTFRNIIRLFAFLFKNGSNDPTRNFLDEYYMLTILSSLSKAKKIMFLYQEETIKKIQQINQNFFSNQFLLESIGYLL